MQRPEAGYLLIADITGYTRFLTGSELDHARGILEQLFSALLDKLKSPFVLSNIQGDAILAHARAAHVADGGHVLDIVESLYCGFAESLEHMLANTTCTCAACRNISNLDLKLVVHHGEYIEQDIAGRKELSGPEVILVHRLMKNKITAATGIRAYAAFTEAAASASGLKEFFAGAIRHTETTDEFGDVALRVADMRPVWEARKVQERLAVEDTDPRAFDDVETDLPVSADRAWHYLTDPNLRGAWVKNVTKFTRMSTAQGRVKVGTVDHCAHGDGSTVVFSIVNWRPHEYVSYHLRIPLGGMVPMTISLSPLPAGCRVRVRTGLPFASNRLVQMFLRFHMRRIAAKIRQSSLGNLARLREIAVRDAAAGSAARATGEVPQTTLQAAINARLAAS
jgi:uncharacterized protein DUF2652/polyketide cyclase/dehydrase/lipid transport protein